MLAGAISKTKSEKYRPLILAYEETADAYRQARSLPFGLGLMQYCLIAT